MRGEIGSVELSAIVAGRLLQAAGLAAWVLVHSGGADAASACREIQDVVDDALSTCSSSTASSAGGVTSGERDKAPVSTIGDTATTATAPHQHRSSGTLSTSDTVAALDRFGRLVGPSTVAH